MKGETKYKSLIDLILQTVKEGQMSVMDAILQINEREGIEIEKLASLVKSSPKLKALLLEEASRLHMMRK